VRNVTAWGNAPGKLIWKARSAEGALWNRRDWMCCIQLRTFSAYKNKNRRRLGRWPRLLHLAPLAL